MTRAEFAPVLARMRSMLEEARRIAAGVSASDQRAAALYGVSVLERAIIAWEGRHLDEVLAGTRPLERWTAHGADLAKQAEGIVRDAGALSAQFSRLADFLGNGAQALLAPLEAQVRELRTRVEELGKRHAAIAKVRDTVKDKPLDTATKSVLFGADAVAAKTNIARLGNLVAGLETGVALLRSGKAQIVRNGDDVRIQPLSGDAHLALGAAPLVVAGWALGSVGVAYGLSRMVESFCSMAEEALRTVVAKFGLEATLAGKGDEFAKILGEQNEGRKPGGWGTLEVVGGLVTAGGLGWLGWKGWKAWKKRQAAQAA